MIAESVGKFAEILGISRSERETGSEMGDGVGPCIWDGANSNKDWLKGGVNGSPFIGTNQSARSIDEVEIFGFSHGKDSSAASIGLDGAEPGFSRV